MMKHALAVLAGLHAAGCSKHLEMAEVEAVAVFSNSARQPIALTTESITIAGVRAIGTDCSNDRFFCTVFPGLAAIIVPRLCKDFSTYDWAVNDHRVSISGIKPHHNSRQMLSNVSSKLAYVVSERDGITDLTYDPAGRIGTEAWNSIPGGQREPFIYRLEAGKHAFRCSRS